MGYSEVLTFLILVFIVVWSSACYHMGFKSAKNVYERQNDSTTELIEKTLAGVKDIINPQVPVEDVDNKEFQQGVITPESLIAHGVSFDRIPDQPIPITESMTIEKILAKEGLTRE